jgi:hypothetical protein
MEVNKIPVEKLQDVYNSIEDKWKITLDEFRKFCKEGDSKTKDGKIRIAYLNGMIHGLHIAIREFEKRQPLVWIVSEKKNDESVHSSNDVVEPQSSDDTR